MRFLVFIALSIGSLGAFAQSQLPPVPPETRHFDFWIGEWEVTQPDGKVAGFSVIEAILDGRAIKESYRTTRLYRGHSYNIYNASESRWEQFWVDNTGLALHLMGGLNEAGQMVLQGDRKDAAGKVVTDRITWTDNGDGSVQQVWESSEDGGKSWTLAFNGRYSPKTKSE